MSAGVFAVSRSIWDDPDFAPEPFSEREAMMWLVSAAAWNDRSVRGTAGPVLLARGEFCFSVRFLAEKWRWSKSRVARFIDKLEKRDTIRDTKRDGVKVYLIRNYNKFQVVGLPKRDTIEDTDRDASGTAAGHERDKEEALKHSSIEDNSGAKAPKCSPRDELAKVLDAERAKAVVEHRQKLKKPLTPHAARLLAGKFAKCADPSAAADEMIARGWQGFEPGWLESKPGSDGLPLGPPKGARPNGTGWVIPFGTSEYWAWREEYAKQNSGLVYDFPEKPPSDGYEAKAPARWPSHLRRG
jgi:hypothetical protein